jgi:hypothetical protein
MGKYCEVDLDTILKKNLLAIQCQEKCFMKFYIYSNDELVGWTELQITDNSMGVASGVFHPETAYPKIRPVAQEFFDFLISPPITDQYSDEKWNQYSAKFDSLNIKIVDADGIVLDTVCFYAANFPSEDTQDMQSTDSIVIEVIGLYWHERKKYFTELNRVPQLNIRYRKTSRRNSFL